MVKKRAKKTAVRLKVCDTVPELLFFEIDWGIDFDAEFKFWDCAIVVFGKRDIKDRLTTAKQFVEAIVAKANEAGK